MCARRGLRRRRGCGSFVGHFLVLGYREHSGVCDTHPVETDFDAPRVVELDVLSNGSFKLPGGVECSAVEHLVFHTPEKPLTRRVIRTAAFLRHRPHHTVLRRQTMPAAPAVMRPAIRMDDQGSISFRAFGFNRCDESVCGLFHGGVTTCFRRDDCAVNTIDHHRKVDPGLVRRKDTDIRQPQCVWSGGMESAA